MLIVWYVGVAFTVNAGNGGADGYRGIDNSGEFVGIGNAFGCAFADAEFSRKTKTTAPTPKTPSEIKTHLFTDSPF